MTRPISISLTSLACALALSAPVAVRDAHAQSFDDAQTVPGTYVPSVPAREGTMDDARAPQPQQVDEAEQESEGNPPRSDKAAQPDGDSAQADGDLFSGGTLIQPSGLKVGLASSADPRATEVGMQILREGGSAADAAMAMMVALTVVEPQSSGIGGGGFLLHASGTDGTVTTVDGRETAPITAQPGRFLGPDGQPLPFVQAFQGGKSVGVPGNIRLMAMVHDKWGKLPWADLFQPAIQLAEGGYDVDKTMAERLRQIAPLWDRFPDAKAVYWKNGAPAKLGDTITNPKLAETFERLAELGPDAFYSGQTATEIVNAVHTTPVNAGDLTQEDLTAYAAEERPAVCMPYREYKICGMGPPSSGATSVLQILGMLEHFDLAALGSGDPQSWHLIGEAMRLAYADREAYLGDPSFVYVPVEGLLNKDYLTSRAALIKSETSLGTYEPGTPPDAEPRTPAPSGEVAGTSHFVAVDKDGNVVSMTSTIEGPFGSQLMASGFFLNNELTDFTFAPERGGEPVANAVKGGKRPLSSMSPTIVFDGQGRPVLALGSAGGKRIIMHVAKTLIGFIDWDYPIDQAIALPNIFYGGDGLIVEQDTPLAPLAPQIEAFGTPVVVGELPSKVNAALWTENGWEGAADPRSEGTAQAE
ncbi:gamma-glutamyltransferase [Novosphingopyxis sp.]|uniref:gamma-glutamyltransferase n=1 Tax=Novosphingopyxis sp. TaxID=2709690 RepID=UPI003B5981F0